jgi:hypothetical protein
LASRIGAGRCIALAAISLHIAAISLHLAAISLHLAAISRHLAARPAAPLTAAAPLRALLKG